ncbi:MAG: V4R domain-containing protein [Candidatus Eisenbacteria bacterium]
MSYTSARKLCAVARGICRGLARHFEEVVVIDEPSCMLRGGRTCEIIVRQSS